MPLTPGLLVSRKQRDIRGDTSLMVGEGFVDKKINQGSLPGRPENLKRGEAMTTRCLNFILIQMCISRPGS